MKGRKMEPSPNRTRGSFNFSSGAILSKSLAKNSSGSLAAVRGLRSLHASRVDGVDGARRLESARRRVDGARRLGVSGCLRRTFGVGRRRALLVRVLLKNLAPHIRAE